MKIKAYFRHLACLGLIFILCLSVTACYNGHAEYSDSEYNGNADYKIISENGKHYIVFDDISRYYSKTPEGTCILRELNMDFKSVKEFKSTVAKGNLTDDQKEHIVMMFKKDENGNIPVCDFDKLYTPALPKNISAGGPSWRGETYSFRLSSDDGIYGYINYLTQSSYKELFDYEYETFFDRDLIHVTETKDLGGGKTETLYYTSAGQFKSVRFSMNVGGKTIIVDKDYCLNRNCDGIVSGPPESSDSYLSQVHLYCDEGDKFWSASLFGFTEDPTDEWLMQFGLAPYVETDAETK